MTRQAYYHDYLPSLYVKVFSGVLAWKDHQARVLRSLAYVLCVIQNTARTYSIFEHCTRKQQLPAD